MLPALEFPLTFLLPDSICFPLDTLREIPFLPVVYTIACDMYNKEEGVTSLNPSNMISPAA